MSRAGRSRRVVAGLTLSAAAVAAAFASPVGPLATSASERPAEQPVVDDAWSSAGDPGANMPVTDVFSAPVRAKNLRAPVSARGAGAALRLARPANIPAASYDDLPPAALAAYQRAAAVMEAADRGCKIDWQLLAALGRVRSDHGRSEGGKVRESGVVSPALVGRRLDGRRGTPRLRDSDAGQLDGDKRFDRAVGPMQVLPSTWSVVGVDADGDGKRNPQDVDDAALSSAVHLCSGEENLLWWGGRRAALGRVDGTPGFANLVLRVRRDYLLDTPTLSDVAGKGWSAAPGLGDWDFEDPAKVLAELRGPGRRGADKPGPKKGSKDGAKAGSKAGSKDGAKDGAKAGSKAGSKDGAKDGAKAGSKDGAKDGSRGGAAKDGQATAKPGSKTDSGKDTEKDPGKDGDQEPQVPAVDPEKEPEPEPQPEPQPDKDPQPEPQPEPQPQQPATPPAPSGKTGTDECSVDNVVDGVDLDDDGLDDDCVAARLD